MKKNILSILILVSGILISGTIIGLAYAQTEPLSQLQEQKNLGEIQYPILTLGNCKSKNDCKVFCDDIKNSDVCLVFAEQNNLMSSEELANAKKFQDNGMVGPGGCKGQTACEQYCGTSIHIEECTAFAEKNGMMSDQQLQDSKKVIAALKSGLKPPACAGPTKCNAYCSNPLHMEECMTFSLAAGIVPDDQKVQMQKTLDAIKQGVKPPACQPNPPSDQLGQIEQTDQSNNGLPKCDEYCGTHMEECMSFSLATGMVPDDQRAQMQKTLDVFKQGIKPPACQPNPPSDQLGQSNQSGQKNQNKPNQSDKSREGLQACDEYCADPSHVEECVKFSVAMGNMTEEQGQNSIKNGNKGPGGCIGKDACDTFCNNPDNQDTCFNFAKDNGMISEEDLQRMQNGQLGQNQNNQGQINEQIEPWADMCQPDGNGNPTELACADDAGGFVTDAKIGVDKQPVCPEGSIAKCGNYPQIHQQGQNQQNQNQQNQNQQGQKGDKFQPGPGTENPGGQQMPQQAGPGGCKGPEECQKYCTSNPEVCKNFQPKQNQQNQPNQFNQKLPQQQPGQPNQGVTNVGPCGTGPGTCSGIGPDDINSGNGSNGGSLQFNQPNQMQPQQQFNQDGQPNQNQPEQPNQFNQPNQLNQINQPQQQSGQIQIEQQQQQNPPPPSTSFLFKIKNLLANVFSVFR